MRKRMWGAFTLVELVIVIAIVGILAAIAIPRFIDIRKEAHNSSRDGIVGAVRAGILTVASKNQVAGTSGTFPLNLEEPWNSIGTGCPGACAGTKHPGATACSADPCFETIMEGGFSDAQWNETTGNTYAFDNPVSSAAADDKTYTYNGTTGTFK